MNYRQEDDGTITAIFRAEEIATLVRIVKGAEQLRLLNLEEVQKKVSGAIQEAESAINPPSKEERTTL